jgi:hypothetical protein
MKGVAETARKARSIAPYPNSKPRGSGKKGGEGAEKDD